MVDLFHGGMSVTWPVGLGEADPRPYVRLAARLRREISTGALAPGHPAPSITALCEELGYARGTCSKAMQLLDQSPTASVCGWSLSCGIVAYISVMCSEHPVPSHAGSNREACPCVPRSRRVLTAHYLDARAINRDAHCPPLSPHGHPRPRRRPGRVRARRGDRMPSQIVSGLAWRLRRGPLRTPIPRV